MDTSVPWPGLTAASSTHRPTVGHNESRDPDLLQGRLGNQVLEALVSTIVSAACFIGEEPKGSR